MNSACFTFAHVWLSSAQLPWPESALVRASYTFSHTVGTEWVTKIKLWAQCHVVHSQPKISQPSFTRAVDRRSP